MKKRWGERSVFKDADDKIAPPLLRSSLLPSSSPVFFSLISAEREGEGDVYEAMFIPTATVI
jgi:hypothetical protein